jgi:hypothetical protein
MAALGMLIAIPVTIAVRGGDDESDGGATTVEPEVPPVGEIEFDRKLGVELRVPEGWKRRERDNAITYRSNDGTVLIAITAPGPADDVDAIQRGALNAIESQYRKVEVADKSSGQRLGGRRAVTAAITARHPKEGTPLRILVSTAKGDKRAYLVEVFASGSDPTAALVEAQVLLNNLRLKG